MDRSVPPFAPPPRRSRQSSHAHAARGRAIAAPPQPEITLQRILLVACILAALILSAIKPARGEVAGSAAAYVSAAS